MSGTTTFLLKNVLQDLTLDLDHCSCSFYDQPKHLLYLGMKTGEIFALRFELYQYKATAHPRLFFSPGFEATGNEVVSLIGVKMPFSELTVPPPHQDSSAKGLISVHADGRIRLWDVQDGKCVMVSRENKFKSPRDIIKIGGTNDSNERFLFILGTPTSPRKVRHDVLPGPLDPPHPPHRPQRPHPPLRSRLRPERRLRARPRREDQDLRVRRPPVQDVLRLQRLPHLGRRDEPNHHRPRVAHRARSLLSPPPKRLPHHRRHPPHHHLLRPPDRPHPHQRPRRLRLQKETRLLPPR